MNAELLQTFLSKTRPTMGSDASPPLLDPWLGFTKIEYCNRYASIDNSNAIRAIFTCIQIVEIRNSLELWLQR